MGAQLLGCKLTHALFGHVLASSISPAERPRHLLTTLRVSGGARTRTRTPADEEEEEEDSSASC